MAAPSMVFTARYAAGHLGVDIDVIEELAEQMSPEDGRLGAANAGKRCDKRGIFCEPLLDQPVELGIA